MTGVNHLFLPRSHRKISGTFHDCSLLTFRTEMPYFVRKSVVEIRVPHSITPPTIPFIQHRLFSTANTASQQPLVKSGASRSKIVLRGRETRAVSKGWTRRTPSSAYGCTLTLTLLLLARPMPSILQHEPGGWRVLRGRNISISQIG
jgi:hypothetical protein